MILHQDYCNSLLHIADAFSSYARLQHSSGGQLQSHQQCSHLKHTMQSQSFCSTISAGLQQKPWSAEEKLLPSRATVNQLGQDSVDTCPSSPPLERKNRREKRGKEWGNNSVNWTPAYKLSSFMVFSQNLSQSLSPCLKPSSGSLLPSG